MASPLMQPSAAAGAAVPTVHLDEIMPSAGGAGGAVDEVEAEPGLSMLQKMGWSEGQGLGKDGQGMKTPLVARKTDGATVRPPLRAHSELAVSSQ